MLSVLNFWRNCSAAFCPNSANQIKMYLLVLLAICSSVHGVIKVRDLSFTILSSHPYLVGRHKFSKFNRWVWTNKNLSWCECSVSLRRVKRGSVCSFLFLHVYLRYKVPPWHPQTTGLVFVTSSSSLSPSVSIFLHLQSLPTKWFLKCTLTGFDPSNSLSDQDAALLQKWGFNAVRW